MPLPLTVVVITKNEENNIADCLKSVHGWAGEIVIVDDESSDRTVEIAKQYTDKIFHRRMDNEGIHRNWAKDQARYEWVLMLDADQQVSAELRQEVEEKLPVATAQAFSIPMRTYIGDYWVRHSGWYPANKMILFKKACLQYEEVAVHPRMFLDGDSQPLSKDIIHKGYRDIEHLFSSMNRQTTLEALKWIKTGRSFSFGRALWRTLDRFFRCYVRKKAYKDGLFGFCIALNSSLYQTYSYLKYQEILKGQREAKN